MHKSRWILIVTISVMLGLMTASRVLGASLPPAEPSLIIEIMAAQTEVTVGSAMTWRIVLTPRGQQSISSLELRPGDARAWAWPDGIQTVGAVEDTAVLDVTAVPLVSGDLHPILEARSIVGEERRMQLALGQTSVRVRSVEELVEADVIARRGTVRRGDRFPVEFWIRNSSPFALKQVQIHGSGVDLTWEQPKSPLEIPPGGAHLQVLYARVGGEHPRPQLHVDYIWTDSLGNSHMQSLNASAEALSLAKISIEEPWRMMIGVVTGSLVALIPAYIREEISRKRQKKANRAHVVGLLRLMALQSEHAANNGIRTELKPLTSIFEKEGLFAVVEDKKLAQHVRDLWKAAERHNSGLDQRGGVQRAEELRKAAQALNRKLERKGDKR